MTLEELSKLVESRKSTIVINKGVTPLSLLGIAFIVMKITGYITWSWLWVLAPFWLPICIALIFLILVLGIVIIAANKTVNTLEQKVTSEAKIKEEESAKSETEECKCEAPKEEKVKKSSKKKTVKKEVADGGIKGKNE